MKINEIELVSDQNFPVERVKRYLEYTSPKGILDEFTINYAELPTAGILQIVIILTDVDSNIAAYAGFVSRLNGRVWQARNAASYLPYNKKALVAKLYKHIKEVWKQSIQSDDMQSLDAKKLWTKTLPDLGLNPKIFDTTTEKIIDPNLHKVNVYSTQEPRRYIWILEKDDHYPEQNTILEELSLMPVTGLWYKQ